MSGDSTQHSTPVLMHAVCRHFCREVIAKLRACGAADLYAASMSPPAAMQILSALRLIQARFLAVDDAVDVLRKLHVKSTSVVVIHVFSMRLPWPRGRRRQSAPDSHTTVYWLSTSGQPTADLL